MEKKLNVDISIEGTTITHFSSFMLKQRFNEHHYFELRFNHDQMGLPGMITLEQSRNFIGKNLSVQFSAAEGEQVFVGKITRVELAQSHGYHGMLIVSGYSPTILIDRGPDLGSYYNKDLRAIVAKATEDAPANDLNIQLQPARTAPIDYVIQYRESDFEFLNRLSAEYHEWFFYDGVRLHFGKPGRQDEVALVYGRDVHSLQYGMSIAPLKYRRFAYNPKIDELLQAESKGDVGGQPDLVHAVKASNEVYSKVYNQPATIRVDNKSDIDSYVSNEEKALVSDLLKVSGSGDNPGVKLGGIVDISMSVRQGLGDFATESLGKFLVTGIYHELDGVGHYHNTFEAVVSDTQRIIVKSVHKPQPDLQLADVIDNDDPQKQGRIRVQFKWQCSSNDPTEWLRVVSPNAGNGDTGGNRGFFVVPEKGDQVVVAFEEGNIARPVVLGSVYSGKTANSGGFSNSGTKAFNSRKGSTLTFNDTGHALTLQTSPSASMQMDNSGKINVNANDSFTITCGQSSITLNKDGTINIKGIKLTLEGQTSTEINKEKGETTVGNSTKHTNIHGDNLIATGNTTVVKSKGQMNINGDQLVNIKSCNVKIN
jgi:uncharacterized protein involved in type VI secretion and phage assembly